MFDDTRGYLGHSRDPMALQDLLSLLLFVCASECSGDTPKANGSRKAAVFSVIFWIWFFQRPESQVDSKKYENIHHMSKAPPNPISSTWSSFHQYWHILMWFTREETIPLSIHTRGSGSSNTSSRKELMILSIPNFTYLGTAQHWWLSTRTYVYTYTCIYIYIYRLCI